MYSFPGVVSGVKTFCSHDIDTRFQFQHRCLLSHCIHSFQDSRESAVNVEFVRDRRLCMPNFAYVITPPTYHFRSQYCVQSSHFTFVPNPSLIVHLRISKEPYHHHHHHFESLSLEAISIQSSGHRSMNVWLAMIDTNATTYRTLYLKFARWGDRQRY